MSIGKDAIGEEQPPRAKALRLPLAATDPVPARMVNELLYCERLMFLEWVQGEWADNHFTTEGRFVHRRADGHPRPLKPSSQAEGDTVPDKPYTARSVWLTSENLGLTAKIDVVDDAGDGSVVPIEYKRGKRPKVPEGAYLPERAQLCAQVLLLRDHGYQCREAAIYFADDHRRVPIAIDDALVEEVLAAVDRARELATTNVIPPPLTDSPKCNGCSLVGICLPDELTHLADDADTRELPELAGNSSDQPSSNPPIRRLHPARDDRVPLVVQEHGARIGVDGERLSIRSKDGAKTTVRLSNTSQVTLLGNVQVSAQAQRALLQRNIPLTFFTFGGWYLGRLVGHDHNNVHLRIAQHAAASKPALCLRLAQGFVRSKILNCRTLLRRNGDPPDRVALSELKQLSRKVDDTTSLESLLGLEGTAARVYFAQLPSVLKARNAAPPEGAYPASWSFDWNRRNRRPPTDPINALLSFTYSLLTKELALVLATVGLDAQLGFYHQPRHGKPALALDLMEEFRPLIADSVVITVVNNGIVLLDDFVHAAGSVALKSGARGRLIRAYERRMDDLVTHPVFGYRISYRRVLEVQARLLARHLMGEVDEYPSFRTR